MRRPHRSHLAALVVATAAVTAPAQTLLHDDFDDGVLDPALWTAVTTGIPHGYANVLEQNGYVELQNRGHLVTAQQFDPNRLGGLSVHCTWTPTTYNDFVQILTRTDGVPAGTWGETQNGLEFFAALETPDSVQIRLRGTNIVLHGTPTTTGSLTLHAGTTYDVDVVDAGWLARVTITDRGSGASMSASSIVLGDQATAYHVAFHNREYHGATHAARVDDVRITRLTPAATRGLGTGCGGRSGPPTLVAATLPVLGQTFWLHVRNARPLTGGYLLTGLSPSSSPLDLGPVGMPGCTLHVAPLHTLSFGTDFTGLAQIGIALPSDAAFSGARIWQQAIVGDTTVRWPAPLGMTNAIEATLGY